MFINTKQTQISKPFNFKEIITKYTHHWYFFALGVSLTFFAAFLYLRVTKPIYQINASLMVKDDEKNPDDKSALYELNLTDPHKAAENEIGILQSRNLIGQVVNDLQLWCGYTIENGLSTQELYSSSPVKFKLLKTKIPGDLDKKQLQIKIKDKTAFFLKMPGGEFKAFGFQDTVSSDFGTWQLIPGTTLDNFAGSTVNINLSDPDKISNQYQKNIDVSLLDKKAPTIELSINDRIVQRGKDILNDLIRVYNQAAVTEKNRVTQSALSFIDKRLSSLTGEVGNAEKQVESFRSSHGLTDISSQSQIYLQNVQSNDASLNQVNVKLNIISGIEKYLNSNQNSINPPSTLGIDDPALGNLIEKLSALQLQRSQLLASVPADNPAFNPIDKQIASINAAIKEKITSIKSSLRSTKNELESFNSKVESSIKNMPNQERQYVDLKRQQSIKESLYVYLLQKREEVSLSYASTLADARIVDNAYSGPVKWPQNSVVYALAFLLGLTLPAGVIYGKGIIRNKITTIRDIENTIDVPVIAELAFIKSQNPIVIDKRKNFVIAEQIRMLRTNLLHLFGNKENGRVSLITSSVAGEGKSFVSINLGISLASSGKKTIILEMDVRKPKISEAFGLSNRHPGLSDFLTKKIPIQNIIQASALIDNLYILSCGSIGDIAPSELFEKKQLAELLKYLQANYDDIIIDTPPMHLVTDAMIVSKFADITLYLIRQGYTGKAELAFINSLDKGQRLPKLNIIFNGIQRTKYGYGYKYDNKYYN